MRKEEDLSPTNTFHNLCKKGQILDNNIILGYDEGGKLLYVEVIDASKKGLINILLAKTEEKQQTNPLKNNIKYQ